MGFISVCLVSFMVSMVIANSAYAGNDKYDKFAVAAWKRTGKTIYVSPKGNNGTMEIMEAVKELQPGSILRIAPGRYQDAKKTWLKRIEIDADNITIEGDGSGQRCDLTLVLWGKNCVVRNIWISSVEAEGVTIVDSRLAPVICSSSSFSSSLIYNCILQNAAVYANNTETVFKNCTFVRMYTPPRVINVAAQWKVSGGGGGQRRIGGYGGIVDVGQIVSKATISFINSIIYTNGYLIQNRWSISGLRVLFQNNCIYCGQGFVRREGNTGGANKKFADLKQICRVKTAGKNEFKEVQFRAKPSPNNQYFATSQYVPSSPALVNKEKIGADL